jgi:thioredoxin reductase (NADPH)
MYAARAGLAPLVLMGDLEAGGALMTTSEVENFPGFRDGIDGPVLMEDMRAQAERFGAQLRSEAAVELDLAGPVKIIVDSSGGRHEARSVILAMGSRYRKIGLDDEARLSGKGVSWCATCDGYPYRDRSVVVVGGGDSAAEEAAFLARLGADVTLVHRRSELRASRTMADRVLSDNRITVLWDREVVGIHGAQSLEAVTVRDLGAGTDERLETPGLFVAIGHDPRSELVAGQVETDADGYVVVEHPSTRTSLLGVFACGDLVDREYRQAVTAAGTGCSAALDAERYLASVASESLAAPR